MIFIKLHVIGLLWGQQVTGGFPSQRTWNSESVPLSWRHNCKQRVFLTHLTGLNVLAVYQTPHCHASPCTYIKSPSNTRSNHQKFSISIFDITIFHEIKKTSYHGRCYKRHIQGPVSISDKTSYCKISSSLEVVRFVCRIVRSLWNLTGTSAALLPVCLSNFKVMRSISRLRDFTRSYGKTSCRTLKRCHGGALSYLMAWVAGKNGDVDKKKSHGCLSR